MRNIEAAVAAIEYIESRLSDEKLDLDTVAEAVHYSKYHLHRVFTETVHLTIHDYVLRRRLTEAAKLLVFSIKPTIEIAFLAGYNSQQAFGSIFKAMYKKTLFEFRKNEVFYPLQLKYDFTDRQGLSETKRKETTREIRFIAEDDIPSWIELTRLSVDGFPYLEEAEHITALKRYIATGGALLMFDNGVPVGGMLINRIAVSIDFLAVHPLHRKKGVARDFLDVAFAELIGKNKISITTFREGDKADTGYRKAFKELGFAEGELLTEFGYPTQRMIFSKENKDE
jgi:AraC-like DNA-binding protein